MAKPSLNAAEPQQPASCQPRRPNDAPAAKAPTSWRALRDPDNPENNAAGNRSDWLKHTIWLAGLSALYPPAGPLQQAPAPIHLHSCHAGRGMYRIPADARRAPLERLWQAAAQPLLLQRAQREICHALGVNRNAIDWYAGSALLCQWWRQQQLSQPSRHQLYEWHPETRAVLSASLAQLYPELAPHTQLIVRDTHGGGRFDGESHIAAALPSWPQNSVLLLDPFALWQHPKHAERQRRFVRIFQALSARGRDAPAVSLFFAWSGGSDGGALDGPAHRSACYLQLRTLARQSGHALLEIHWQWDLHCSMWWLLPQPAPEVAARVSHEICEHVRQLIERMAEPATTQGQPARWTHRLHEGDRRA